MESVLIKPEGSISEECCNSFSNSPILSAGFVSIAAQILRAGFKLQLADLQVVEIPDLEIFDVAVVIVGAPESFKQEIKYIDMAKDSGCTTVAVINDGFGYEKEIMEAYNSIDILIKLPEREKTVVKVLDAIENNKDFEKIKGVLYHKDHQIYENESEREEETLDYIGSSVKVYKKLPLKKYVSAMVLTGKGCPMPCSFCSFRKTLHRKRRVEDVLEDLMYLSKFHSNLWLFDLNFAADKEWAKHLLERIIEEKLSAHFATDVRIEDMHDSELMQLMKEADFRLLLAGVEHVSARVQKSIFKVFSKDYIEKGIKNCRKLGIIPRISFIVGFPEESEETILELREFINKTPFFIFDVNILQLDKSQPLFMEYDRQGFLLDRSFRGLLDTSKKPPYCTEYLSSEKIVENVEDLNFIHNSLMYRLMRIWLLFRSKLPF